jgi:hypothetical protein
LFTSVSSTRAPDGLIVRGAKMLATHGPTADEAVGLSAPGIREGEERYVPGVRHSHRDARASLHLPRGRSTPVASRSGITRWCARFEEPDAVCVFRRRADPWGPGLSLQRRQDGKRCSRRASIRNHTGHQTSDPLPGEMPIADRHRHRDDANVKSDVFCTCRSSWENCWVICSSSSRDLMARSEAEPTGRGALRAPPKARCRRAALPLPKMYERMVQVTQVVSAGGLLINPTEADLQSEIGPDIARYYRGAGVDADKRIQLSKLAWDATGTQFGQRMLQYERYYAGDPVRVGASYYLDHDVAPAVGAGRARDEGSRAMNGVFAFKTCVRRTARGAPRSPPVCPAHRCPTRRRCRR